MCGVLAVSGANEVIQDLYEGLVLLQHRGQDAAGIVTYDKQFHLKKGNGLARDVFHAGSIRRLRGNIGVGHVRYPTAGCSSSFEAQPFFVNTPFGIALAHNGNLTNTKELQLDLLQKDYRHLHTNSDSEVLLNVFSVALHNLRPKNLTPNHIFRAVKQVFRRCKGAYSAVALIGGHLSGSGGGIVAFRDPHGIRPLQIGIREGKDGKSEYIIASETITMHALDFRFFRNVHPGEAIFIDHERTLHSFQCQKERFSPCLFEWIYLASPGSTLDNVSVYKARVRMGEALAGQIRSSHIPIDSIIPIPDTGRPMATGLADKLQKRCREGFIKNRYIGRTFIMPGQFIRKRSLQFKLHPIELEFRGKNVLLVDDSIVRGNTSKKIIEIAREAGAKKIYFASAAPPIIGPDPYGIDLPTTDELIAAQRSHEEIREYLGADALFYGELKDIHRAIRYGNPNIHRFSEGCFTRKYPTPEVSWEKMQHLGQQRNAMREEFEEKEHPVKDLMMI